MHVVSNESPAVVRLSFHLVHLEGIIQAAYNRACTKWQTHGNVFLHEMHHHNEHVIFRRMRFLISGL